MHGSRPERKALNGALACEAATCGGAANPCWVALTSEAAGAGVLTRVRGSL